MMGKCARYGVPYKGSKNQIVEWIYSHFPKATNFYDLFAGGCAITHIALMKSEYENYFCNDIDDDGIRLFLDAIHGKYAKEERWISREDFFRLKDKEPYVRYCWSFGNIGRTYLYSKEIELYKKALHYARVLNDFSLLEEFRIKTDKADRITVAKNADEWKKKYIVWYCKEALHSSIDVLELQKNLNEKIKRNSEELRAYLVDGLKKAGKRPCDVDRYLGTKGMAGHYFGKSQWEFPTREIYIKLQSFLVLPIEYEKIYGLQELLQSLESLQRLESLESLQRLQSLTVSQKSYDEVEILLDSVVFCDIPYYQTDGYGAKKDNFGFDYEKFYRWCERQKELVIISEYYMPEERFCRIDSIEKAVLLNSGVNKKTMEKLFVPKSMLDQYYRKLECTMSRLF